MKRPLLLSVVFVSMLAVSCGGSKNAGPQDVAGKFAKTFFVDMNLEASRRFVSAELLEEFPAADEMNDLEKQFVKILFDHAKAHGYRFEYDAESSAIAESAADICYKLTAKGNPDWEGKGEVDLEKDADGKWTVTDYEFDRDESAIDFGF